MRLDRCTCRAVLVLGLCAFMTWMWGSGETLRYLGPRTEWLVPVAAVALAVLAVAAVLAARSDPEPVAVSWREVGGMLALALPVVTAVLLAHTQLGAQAASKKLASRGIDTSALADLAAGHAGSLDFLTLNVAQKDRKFAAENDIAAGKEVRLLGFVSKRGASAAAPFELSRFYITCCVADSIPIGVQVQPPPHARARVTRNEWLSVTGALARGAGGKLVIAAARMRPQSAPKHPYLYVAR